MNKRQHIVPNGRLPNIIGVLPVLLLRFSSNHCEEPKTTSFYLLTLNFSITSLIDEQVLYNYKERGSFRIPVNENCLTISFSVIYHYYTKGFE